MDIILLRCCSCIQIVHTGENERGRLCMWTVIHVALDESSAELAKSVLEEEGILVRLRPVGDPGSGEPVSIEVLVPESEAEEARQVLDEKID